MTQTSLFHRHLPRHSLAGLHLTALARLGLLPSPFLRFPHNMNQHDHTSTRSSCFSSQPPRLISTIIPLPSARHSSFKRRHTSQVFHPHLSLMLAHHHPTSSQTPHSCCCAPTQTPTKGSPIDPPTVYSLAISPLRVFAAQTPSSSLSFFLSPSWNAPACLPNFAFIPLELATAQVSSFKLSLSLFRTFLSF